MRELSIARGMQPSLHCWDSTCVKNAWSASMFPSVLVDVDITLLLSREISKR